MSRRLDQHITETSPSGSSTADDAAPAGDGSYVVRQGDCIASIAFQFGVDPAALWSDDGNAALRRRRTEPSQLLPGDRVAVPLPAARRAFDVSPGGTSRFRARVPRHETRVKLMQGSSPRTNKPCTVVVDGVTTEAQTDGDGVLAIAIRPSTRSALVTLHDEVLGVPYDDVMRIELGSLDPVSAISGVQARLRNLGFNVGPVDGIFGPRTRRAIEQFQRGAGVTVTGEPDDATRDRLVGAHGA